MVYYLKWKLKFQSKGFNMFSTRQLAAQAGVNVETLRFYERKGLMPAPQRTSGGYRQYSEGDLVNMILNCIRKGRRSVELNYILIYRGDDNQISA